MTNLVLFVWIFGDARFGFILLYIFGDPICKT